MIIYLGPCFNLWFTHTHVVSIEVRSQHIYSKHSQQWIKTWKIPAPYHAMKRMIRNTDHSTKYPLVMSKELLKMTVYSWIYPLNMLILHSYVSYKGYLWLNLEMRPWLRSCELVLVVWSVEERCKSAFVVIVRLHSHVATLHSSPCAHQRLIFWNL